MRSPFPRPILICALTALLLGPPAYAADTTPSFFAPDLTRIRALLKAKNYEAALVQLRPMAISDQHADVFNLLGFALRKTGDQAGGMANYQRALAMNPNHKGALEYQGQLFVELGQMDNARANMARLQKLCPSGCEELADLKETIDHPPKPVRK